MPVVLAGPTEENWGERAGLCVGGRQLHLVGSDPSCNTGFRFEAGRRRIGETGSSVRSWPARGLSVWAVPSLATPSAWSDESASFGHTGEARAEEKPGIALSPTV